MQSTCGPTVYTEGLRMPILKMNVGLKQHSGDPHQTLETISSLKFLFANKRIVYIIMVGKYSTIIPSKHMQSTCVVL